MNEVEIIEGGHYKIRNSVLYVEDLFLIKITKRMTGHFFKKEIDEIVYKPLKDYGFYNIMTMDEFKKCVLYKVN